MELAIIKEKLKASGIHLLFSLLIIGIFLLIVYFIWYPYPLYITEGVSKITLLLSGVSLIAGPLLTFIIYKKNKKYLLLDLLVIIVLQLSAFLYGAFVIAQGRPVYIVFATDVFKTVAPNTIDIGSLNNQDLKYSLFSGPVYVYASAPTDPKKRSELLLSTLSGGKDIEKLPEYYQDHKQQLFMVQRKNNIAYINKLHAYPQLYIQLTRIQKKNHLNNNTTGLYAFFGYKKTAIAVVNLKDGEIVDYLDIAP